MDFKSLNILITCKIQTIFGNLDLDVIIFIYKKNNNNNNLTRVEAREDFSNSFVYKLFQIHGFRSLKSWMDLAKIQILVDLNHPKKHSNPNPNPTYPKK